MVITIDFEQCLREGRIVRIDLTAPMIEKEINAAQLDLVTAEDSLSRDNAKWASVQAYYSMFHSAKALVIWKRYREKSHWCLLIALRELLVRTGELDEDLADDFELAMGVRQDADYELDYNMVTAGRVVGKANAMLETTRSILDQSGVLTNATDGME